MLFCVFCCADEYIENDVNTDAQGYLAKTYLHLERQCRNVKRDQRKSEEYRQNAVHAYGEAHLRALVILPTP